MPPNPNRELDDTLTPLLKSYPGRGILGNPRAGENTFLLFRALQGTVISGWVLAMAMIRDTHSEGEAVSMIGYVAMSMAIAPMLGPMIGGLLDEFFGWRASFALYSVMGMAMLLLC